MNRLDEMSPVGRRLARRRRLVAFGLYVAATAALAATGAACLGAACEDWAWLADQAQRPRARTVGRQAAEAPSPNAAAAALLAARTAGVAAADLQQRVEAAARAAGAKTLSSRVDLSEAATADSRLSYAGEIEIDAQRLQALLYDLEAGSPLLEIADLSVQPLQEAEAGQRLRVSLTATAAWRVSP